MIINNTMYHKTWVKQKESRFNLTCQSLQAFRGHHLHYQVRINTNLKLFARLIKNLLNLQTTHPIAINKSYQSFITDIVKLK